MTLFTFFLFVFVALAFCIMLTSRLAPPRHISPTRSSTRIGIRIDLGITVDRDRSWCDQGYLGTPGTRPEMLSSTSDPQLRVDPEVLRRNWELAQLEERKRLMR